MALRKQNNFNMVALDQTLKVSFDDDELQQIEAKYLYNAITILPTRYRNLLNIFVVEGYIHQEIVEILGISEGTSKIKLQKKRLYSFTNKTNTAILNESYQKSGGFFYAITPNSTLQVATISASMPVISTFIISFTNMGS
jgi:hypothetical protein